MHPIVPRGILTSLIVDLTVGEAEALAQFVKRLQWHQIDSNAVDRAEAECMREAIEKLRRALVDAGFNPR
jgi:hypothetical protein